MNKLVAAYKRWQEFLPQFSKPSRHTLGAKINSLLLDITETIFIASQTQKKGKISYLRKASLKLDLLKFFLQISWEMKVLDNKKYITISEHFNEVGKMLGGWIKQLEKETPAPAGELSK